MFSSYNSTQLPSPSRQQYTTNQLTSPPLQGDTYQFVPTPLSSATQFISQSHRIGGSNQHISPQIPDAHQNSFIFASNSQQTDFQKSSRHLPQFTYQHEDKTKSKSPDFKLLPQQQPYKILSFPNMSPTRSPPLHTSKPVDEIQTSQLDKGVSGHSQDDHQYVGDVPNFSSILSSSNSKLVPPHTHLHHQNKGSNLLGNLDTFIQHQQTDRRRISRNPNEHEVSTEPSPSASLNGILSNILGSKPKANHRGKPGSTELQNAGKML